MQQEEQWRPVVGYEGLYEVSDQGRVRSLDREVTYSNGAVRFYKGQKMKQQPLGRYKDNPYWYTRLSTNNRGKTHYIHRLVAEAFIPNPEGKPTVNHLNGDKADNRVENLEWATYKEQMQHAFDTGLAGVTGSAHGMAMLNEEQVYEIRGKLLEGELTHQELGDMYGVTRACISRIATNRSWTHVPWPVKKAA